jgi:S1-C subfamily serine protease
MTQADAAIVQAGHADPGSAGRRSVGTLMKRTLVIVILAALAGGLAGAMIGVGLSSDGSNTSTAAPALAIQTASAPAPSRDALSPETIYRKDAPGVVVITDTQTQVIPPTFFTPRSTQKVGALGSGFVIDRQGDIVTNDHVVRGATGIRVGFSSGSTYPATIVGQDPSTDVAVVRVHTPASALHPLRFDNSARLSPGDPAYAIGNPFGLDRTMTAGIVSATDRDIQAPNGLSIPDAIQTDAPINHGNSGGPLLDRSGGVIGISSQIEGGTVNANVGIGFAVPSDTARSVAAQLLLHGHAEHPWLGVRVEGIDPDVAAVVRGLPAHGAAVVQVVKGSPAARSGLKAGTRQVTVNGVGMLVGGDVIEKVDGKPITSSGELANLVAQHKPGDRLRLDVVRGGRSRNVEVTLANVPA